MDNSLLLLLMHYLFIFIGGKFAFQTLRVSSFIYVIFFFLIRCYRPDDWRGRRPDGCKRDGELGSKQ